VVSTPDRLQNQIGRVFCSGHSITVIRQKSEASRDDDHTGGPKVDSVYVSLTDQSGVLAQGESADALATVKSDSMATEWLP
jgi:hypothetical protein